MHRLIAAATLALGSLALVSAAHADGDAAAGKTLFQQKCALCHSPDKGVNKLGPSLWNVAGQPAAEVPNYTFSAGMKDSHITWDDASLDKWLTNPRAMVAGTKMIFPGLPNAADRQNVIAYLKSLK
ncbi:c-type cytochrome [Acidibrevibacterium fodinaquatile]|uniref:c-type cytochrome n=1 Tax=Acidibrevibacterium fodinaquatile TaxID=1969806 RepID=UPI000E0DA4FE|nr:c-type cytochrome [Acidibrevibacterium fodinaquatile]